MLAGALAALLLASCASNPTGGTNFVLMSEKKELEVGKEEADKLLKNTPIYHDAKLEAYVNKVGQKLAAVSDRPNLTYHFTIIDSPDINAFALPGGYVYVNRGLLAYINNEAQLAAVMGHEIGHITARHAVRQQTAAQTSKILSAAVVIATGVSSLGDTANLFGGALISGYGREMELEADELGAEYIYRAGYDPNAVIDVIEVLKSHEDFMKKTQGSGSSYHGLFATHPRNDTRLQQAIAKVNTLEKHEPVPIDPNDFRQATTGLVVGPSLQNLTGAQARNRYYQNLLKYTIVFPDKWTFEETTTTVKANAPENKGSLDVEVQRLQKNEEPRLYLKDVLGYPDLQQTEILNQFGLIGYTGIDPRNGNRVALLYYNARAYILTGTFTDKALDASILESIKSFRPIARNEGIFANPVEVQWVQADGKHTWADYARESRIPQYPEETLRLMNGDYPSGEPKAGEWIKITN